MVTRGATGGRDLAIVVVLLSTAWIAEGSVATRPGPRGLFVLFLVMATWLVVAGPVRSGLSLETARTLILAGVAYLTVAVVARLDGRQRAHVVRGLIVLGTAHASLAIIEIGGRWLVSGELPVVQLRAEALVGYANALGIILIATAALTARELERRSTAWLVGALAVQAVGVLATGSRLSLLAALLLLAWSATQQTPRRISVPVVGWTIAAVSVLGLRFADSAPTRLHLWASAVRRIVERPVMGRGTEAQIFAIDVPDAQMTTHAHNELLQIGVEYGLIGLILVLAALAVAYRASVRGRPPDRWMALAAIALAVGGLTDFTLRITVVLVITATLATLAMTVAPVTNRTSRTSRAIAASGRQ
jgi:O-antigen ligase